MVAEHTGFVCFFGMSFLCAFRPAKDRVKNRQNPKKKNPVLSVLLDSALVQIKLNQICLIGPVLCCFMGVVCMGGTSPVCIRIALSAKRMGPFDLL